MSIERNIVAIGGGGFGRTIKDLRIEEYILKISNKEKPSAPSNPNLNLLAINVNFRSKGIGKEFMKKIFETFLDKNKETYFTCETYSENAKNFYIKKLKFEGVGKKLRLFKSMYILIKKI